MALHPHAAGTVPPLRRKNLTAAGQILILRRIGAIAQLGERLNGIQEVGGSIPPGSTTYNSEKIQKRPKARMVAGFFFDSLSSDYQKIPLTDRGKQRRLQRQLFIAVRKFPLCP